VNITQTLLFSCRYVIHYSNNTQGVEGKGIERFGEENLSNATLEMHRRRWENIKISLK